MPVKTVAKSKFKKGDLLYHPTHGLCRLERIVNRKEGGKETQFYSLVPKIGTQMKVRFLIDAEQVETSGFHSPISSAEANKILDYLKASNVTASTSAEDQNKTFTSFAQSKEAWTFAKAVLFFSHDKSEVREQRKRQMLDRAVKGLVGELSVVLDITAKEAVSKVRKSLERTLKINPSVLVVLGQAVED